MASVPFWRRPTEHPHAKMAYKAIIRQKVEKLKLFLPRNRSHKNMAFPGFTISGEAKALPKRTSANRLFLDVGTVSAFVKPLTEAGT